MLNEWKQDWFKTGYIEMISSNLYSIQYTVYNHNIVENNYFLERSKETHALGTVGTVGITA